MVLAKEEKEKSRMIIRHHEKDRGKAFSLCSKLLATFSGEKLINNPSFSMREDRDAMQTYTGAKNGKNVF
ncbi:MAG: hypothetical protein V1734_06325 [Nanoarchaeota archaeon]